MTRLRALAVGTSLAVAIAAGDGPCRVAAAQMTQEAALDALRAELTRVGLYLAYFDQVNCLAVAQGQLPLAEAESRLRAQAALVFTRSFADTSFAQLVDPEMTSAHYGLAATYARVGRPAQAIQAYEAYLARDGTSEWAQRARQEVARLRGLR